MAYTAVRSLTAYSRSNTEGTFQRIQFQQRTASLLLPPGYTVYVGGAASRQGATSHEDSPSAPFGLLGNRLDKVWSPLTEGMHQIVRLSIQLACAEGVLLNLHPQSPWPTPQRYPEAK